MECNVLISPSSGARYDIELISIHHGEDVSLVCDYSTELFEAETISRWLNGIATLSDAGLQSDQACGLLPMMPASERNTILNVWNQTEKEFPRERTVLDLVTLQAQTEPEATAIQFGDASLSYGQLLERVDQFASALYQQGVKHGDRVGIMMQRSLDLLPAMLAVWRVGALYVPMDMGFPKQRLSYMLADANIQAVITNRELTSLLDQHAATILCAEDVKHQSDLEAVAPSSGKDSAYVMYTSGSTGRPKGVEVLHSALLYCLLDVQKTY